jgi:hypothetical protein
MRQGICGKDQDFMYLHKIINPFFMSSLLTGSLKSITLKDKGTVKRTRRALRDGESHSPEVLILLRRFLKTW